MAVSPRPLIMGIINVTPDSFSDGGLWADQESAIARGLELAAQGADLIDIGGESTRPGAERPSLAAELSRVIPVIEALSAEGLVTSIDTMRAEVARAAVEAGAQVVNDVSGGLADPAMLAAVAASSATYVAMHWRAHSAHMQDQAHYPRGVVAEVTAELAARRDAVVAAGIPLDRLVLDPGLGFAKTAAHNWELLAELEHLEELGCPLLLGASRKSFLGALLADPITGTPRPTGERETAHAAVLAVVMARHPLWGVRVHDVRAAADVRAAVGAMGVWDD